MKDVKSLNRAVWERTRAVHYVSGDYMLSSWHNASTIAARMGGSVTDDQATSFFIPKRDTHAPLEVLLAFKFSIGQSQKGLFIKKVAFSAFTPPMFKAQPPAHRTYGPEGGRATSLIKFVMRIF